jgi:hypothetical protein
MRKGLVLASLAALAVGMAFFATEIAAATDKLVDQFVCNAVNMSGVGARKSGTIIIGIERWSTEEERELLRGTLLQKGPDALLGALQSVKPRVGYVRASNTMGWDLYYARDTRNPDGTRKIFLATDRHMAFGEIARDTRSSDYEFTLVEIHFDAKGKGEGKLSLAVKVDIDPKTNQIELENYAQRPVDLVNVTSKTKK